MRKLICTKLFLGMMLLGLVGCEDKPKEGQDETQSFVEKVAGTEITMVYVEGGAFDMGATPDQGRDAFQGEKPMHTVTLDGFYIGRYEVTQAQWQAIMGTTIEDLYESAVYDEGLPGVGADYPIYYVSWTMAGDFCRKLSQATGKTYRLPTEAEWEYAARGGVYKDGTRYSGDDELDKVGWYADNGDAELHPVGKLAPNGLKTYDMSGNVWEWCSDWYQRDYYAESPEKNPQGPEMGMYRCIRGGGWTGEATRARVACRMFSDVTAQGSNIGFRIVCEL